MNKTTPYEDLMAAKLDQIPVPDMSDSIWASIEMQLDEIPATPEDKSSGGKTGNAWYGVATLIAVVTLCWFFYDNKKPVPQKEVIPPTEIIQTPKDSPVLIQKMPKQLPPVIIMDTVMSITPMPEEKEEKTEVPVMVDTIAAVQEKIDSVQVNPPVQKKPKGVKGITSDDYRLSVKKDSIEP